MTRWIVRSGLAVFLVVFHVSFAIASMDTKDHENGNHMDHGIQADVVDGFVLSEDMEDNSGVGIDEKTGSMVTLDAVFKDENGRDIRLGDLIDRPVVILPAFYTCPRSCILLLSNLATAMNHVALLPGKDFRMITLSFDDDETPGDAKKAKANYLPLLPSGFPENEWVFLTGDKMTILSVTESMGYHFKKTDTHTFVHPNALIVVSGKGQIIRYVYGPSFLGPDIAMALTEAAKGEPAVSIKRIMSFCFNYDPASNRYVFQTFKVSAWVIMGLLLLFFVFVLSRKRKTGKNDKDPHPIQGERNRDHDTIIF